jgi:hypothetical protein
MLTSIHACCRLHELRDRNIELNRYGRQERPMLLLCSEKPQYLFDAAQGGRSGTSSTFIFKIG